MVTSVASRGAGNPDYSDPRGLVFWGVITTLGSDSTYQFYCPGLAGYGDDYFYDWYIYVVHKEDDSVTAPFGEKELCNGYTSSSGYFTQSNLNAFTYPLAVGDEVYLIHPDVVASSIISGLLDHIQKVFVKSITSACNAGNVTIATVSSTTSTRGVVIDSIVVQEVGTGMTANSNYIKITGCGGVIIFIDSDEGFQQNLQNAQDIISWKGTARMRNAETIVINLNGIAATAVALVITITYHAEEAGGTLS